MARKSGASSTMGSAPTVRWVFSSPVPVLEVLVLVWPDPPQAAVANNVANPAAMMQAVLWRGNIMTLLAGRNSQRGGANHTGVVPGPRACPPCGGTPTLAENDEAVTASDLSAANPAYRSDGPLSWQFTQPGDDVSPLAGKSRNRAPPVRTQQNSDERAAHGGGRPAPCPAHAPGGPQWNAIFNLALVATHP